MLRIQIFQIMRKRSLAIVAPKLTSDIMLLEIDQKKEVHHWLPTVFHRTLNLNN
jgi:hypothetical protein